MDKKAKSVVFEAGQKFSLWDSSYSKVSTQNSIKLWFGLYLIAYNIGIDSYLHKDDNDCVYSYTSNGSHLNIYPDLETDPPQKF